jgi:sortase A
VFGLVLVMLLTVAAWVFEGPVAHLWYQSRQHHLAKNFQEPTKGIHPGEAVAVLQAPTIGLNVMVIEGDNPSDLRQGPGHQAGTPLPGSRGNSIIVGHRSGWGGPFGSLKRLVSGNYIYVQSRQGYNNVTRYQVTSVQQTSDERSPLLARTTDRRITLVTDAAGRLSSKWLIVSAVAGPAAQPSARQSRHGLSLPRGSLFVNSATLGFLLRALGAVAVVLALRRRHRPAVTAAVAAPLAVAALLPLLLELDLWLPGLG